MEGTIDGKKNLGTYVNAIGAKKKGGVMESILLWRNPYRISKLELTLLYYWLCWCGEQQHSPNSGRGWIGYATLHCTSEEKARAKFTGHPPQESSCLNPDDHYPCESCLSRLSRS